MIKRFFVAPILCILAVGCSTTRDFSPYECPVAAHDALRKINLIEMSDALLSSICVKPESDADRDEVVLVPDLLDLNTLQSGQTGMLLGELVRSRLSGRCGYKIRQVELAKTLKLNESGASLLTRDVKQLTSETFTGRRAFIGTYSAMPNKMLVTLREVDLNSGTINRSSSREVSFGCTHSPLGERFSYEVR